MGGECHYNFIFFLNHVLRRTRKILCGELLANPHKKYPNLGREWPPVYQGFKAKMDNFFSKFG
jgi:hypothetical protein